MNSEQLHNYKQNGYLIISNFITDFEISLLKSEINTIIKSTPLSEIQGVFSSSDESNFMKLENNMYLLDSANKIKIFLEKNRDERIPLELSVNKIAHTLHRNRAFAKITHNTRIKAICNSLEITKPMIAHSMYIFKSPNIGGEVKPHVDNTYLYTDPLSCTGFWIPLDDVTQENGCMWFVPGSHNLPLTKRFKRNNKNELYYECIDSVDTNSNYVPIEVEKGSLVIFNGGLIHKSETNKSDKSRNVYTFHIIDGSCEWSYENWLQYPYGDAFDCL